MEILGYIILGQILLFLLTMICTNILKEEKHRKIIYLIRLLLVVFMVYINFTGYPSNYIRERIITLIASMPAIISLIFVWKENDKCAKSLELISWAFWIQMIIFLK